MSKHHVYVHTDRTPSDDYDYSKTHASIELPANLNLTPEQAAQVAALYAAQVARGTYQVNVFSGAGLSSSQEDTNLSDSPFAGMSLAELSAFL